MNPLISLVIPIFNEEENIRELHERSKKTLEKIGPHEIIFVNDGSRDKTFEKILELADKDKGVKIIDFSRNFGHQTAITAGIDNSQGEAVVIMDGDLQDTPETMLELVKKWKEGYEVVYAKRRTRKDSCFKRGVILFDREERKRGNTSYPLKKMLKFAYDGITSFSYFPLKMATYLGVSSAFMGFIWGIYAIYHKIYNPETTVQGWTTVVVAIFFLGGIQLIVLGMIGEYVGRIYTEAQNRPPYIVRQKINFD